MFWNLDFFPSRDLEILPNNAQWGLSQSPVIKHSYYCSKMYEYLKEKPSLQCQFPFLELYGFWIKDCGPKLKKKQKLSQAKVLNYFYPSLTSKTTGYINIVC